MKRKKALRRPPQSWNDLGGDIKPLLNAITKGDDLSCALVGAASVENALMHLLRRFLVKCDESEGLFEIKGDLDSLSKCNRMAFCLGLITRQSNDNIKRIAQVRNTIAHSVRPVDFSDKEIGEICANLQFPIPVKGKRSVARNRYRTAVHWEWVNLFCDSSHIKDHLPIRTTNHFRWDRLQRPV